MIPSRAGLRRSSWCTSAVFRSFHLSSTLCESLAQSRVESHARGPSRRKRPAYPRKSLPPRQGEGTPSSKESRANAAHSAAPQFVNRTENEVYKDYAAYPSFSSLPETVSRREQNQEEDDRVEKSQEDDSDLLKSKVNKFRGSRNLLLYSRRVEGLLENDGPVLQDVEAPTEQQPIATLAHGLDRVLFNPGVHWLQDPRSRVYNFTPWLEHIPKVNDFAFERLTGFVKSSRDEDLWTLAKNEKRMFAGSTSSLSGMLCHIYFLISGNRLVDTSTLSRSFANQPKNFTPGQRMPASVVMNYRDGVYTIDSDQDEVEAEKNILTWMGTLLEKLLTLSPQEFATKFMRSVPAPDEALRLPEAYRYSKSERFVMRSQLDCYDRRLPGTGVFDIKTRACLPIRLDRFNLEENTGYLIRHQHGTLESFEREYYDLIRAAFLKYNFQARIGNMDGVIVAYHNVSRMFGFQYVPLEEIDERLFGPNPGIGDQIFAKCVNLLEIVLTEVSYCFPGKSVKVTFETQEDSYTLDVWVEPAEWDSEEPRPIRQLQIQTDSFVKDEHVKKHLTFDIADDTWTVHWSVRRLSTKALDVRDGLEQAMQRKKKAYSLPTDVDVEQMRLLWNEMNFGGRDAREADTFSPDRFKKADKSIMKLRAVARSGRRHTERLEQEEAGKPKVVLVDFEPIPEDVLEAVRGDNLSSPVSTVSTAALDDNAIEAAAESELCSSPTSEADEEPQTEPCLSESLTTTAIEGNETTAADGKAPGTNPTLATDGNRVEKDVAH